MYSDIKKLWSHLTLRRQWQFRLIMLLMVIVSFAEMVSIGAVLPFISVLTNPDIVYQYSQIQPIIALLKIDASDGLVLPITVIFVIVSLVAGVLRLTLLYVITRLSYTTGGDISVSMYKRTLYQSYSTHVSRNSSQIINGITHKSNIVIHEVINPLLIFISSIFTIIGVMLALIIIDTAVAFYSFVSFATVYLLIIMYTKNSLNENSKKISQESTNIIKALQEGLGGIRDVLIDGSQKVYCEIYRNADFPLRIATGMNRFIGIAPKYVIESLGMVLIAILAYFLSQRPDGMTEAVPFLGALALGAQRLLPAAQQVYGATSTIIGSRSSFKDVLKLLDQPLPNDENILSRVPLAFEKEIRLENLSFGYSEDNLLILKNINLRLPKGVRVGFVGTTGSGKSTLLDIVMGLLIPMHGNLIVDDQIINNENRRLWQAHISHVPQNIYLSDSTIEENIAFGVPKEIIDHQQVKKVAELAQIAELIEGWQDGYQTFVGERGVRLSGGQRQRIGIARALYKKADVLIFDEATSALDSETEENVMKAIESLGKELTILIIAHRLTTLKECDFVVELGGENEFHIKEKV